MGTQMIEATTENRNGQIASMLHGSQEATGLIRRISRDAQSNLFTAFFSRPTWLTMGGAKHATHLKSREYRADPALRLGAFFSRPTWITTGTATYVDSRQYTADSAIRMGKDMTDTGQGYSTFFSRPTWIATGVYELPRSGEASVATTGEYVAERPDHADHESLRFATAVLAMKLALAGFRGRPKAIRPRIG